MQALEIQGIKMQALLIACIFFFDLWNSACFMFQKLLSLFCFHRFVRENRQMANKKLYREDVLQMLFTDSDSEGEYLPFGNDDRSSNDRASPGTSLLHNGAAVQGASVHEAQTSDHLDPLPNGDGGGRGGHGRSVHRRAVAL